ncbi:apolipoprotein N-acyltransferase [Roseovarius sp. EL26]|uniref:apolipoprotein N-acyltransferase n=1 Tax=Roseovarius sp. EL26 TaxID=2126672 RepID=UPI0020B14B6B|nr:apolipoprotein N-acyltransferase [Roseovarius sp. EL26]
MLLAAGFGAVAALGQAPVGLWPATVVALALVFGLFRHSRNWKHAARLGWAVGTGYFMLALSWIVEPFLVDVARHGWMAPFALIGLSAGLALLWAAGFAIARATGTAVGGWIVALTLAETARTYILTGFPWAQPGHVWIDTPMLHWASYGGSLLLTALLFVAASALWFLIEGKRGLGVAGLAGIILAYGAGNALTPDNIAGPDAPIVRVIQPNAAQHEKWDPDKVQIFFDRQIAFTRESDGTTRPDLVVWPETAIPVLLNNAGSTLDAIADAAQGVPVVLGAQRYEGVRFYNAMAVLDGQGELAAVYDKSHLVPFGEYVPFGDFLTQFGISGMAAREGNGYSSGPGMQVLQIEGLGGALALICYEGVFPQDVNAAPVRPDFLMLITNDAWFGQISGPYQHLAQARLRSVEQGLPMIRAANTGVSAMIDAAGRVTASLPLGVAGWQDAALPPPLPITVYARLGDGPLIITLLAIWALSKRLERRRGE